MLLTWHCRQFPQNLPATALLRGNASVRSLAALFSTISHFNSKTKIQHKVRQVATCRTFFHYFVFQSNHQNSAQSAASCNLPHFFSTTSHFHSTTKIQHKVRQVSNLPHFLTYFKKRIINVLA